MVNESPSVRPGKAEFTVEGACSECLRLGWFPANHETEIQRCDNCKVFESDDAAHAYALELAAAALATGRRRSGKRYSLIVEALLIAAWEKVSWIDMKVAPERDSGADLGPASCPKRVTTRTKSLKLYEAIISIGLTWRSSSEDSSRVDILDPKSGEVVLRCATGTACWELYWERTAATPKPSTEQAKQILARLKPGALDVLRRGLTHAVVGPQAAALARMKLLTYAGPVDAWSDRGKSQETIRRSYEATALGSAVVQLADEED